MSFVSVVMLIGIIISRIHDGDRFTAKNHIRWRLWGVDALEIGQVCNGKSCGLDAREALVAIIGMREVTCTQKGRSYDRLVGQCFVGETDLSREMVRAGWAFDMPKYSNGLYSTDQTDARDHRRGMWGMSGVVRPDVWRRKTR